MLQHTHCARTLVVVGLVAAWLVPAAARANVLTDPSFENNALLPGTGVLTNIPGNAGIWGTENANIVGPVGAVSPSAGVKMLQMLDDGAAATQGWQAVDISGVAAAVDAGLATYIGTARYNVDSTVPAAAASTAVIFLDSTATWGNFSGPASLTGLTLDANPATWESITDAGAIPVGTRWLVIQVAYSNATLIGTQGIVEAGYVDEADLDVRVVPEPASLGILGAAAGAVLLRRRRD